MTIDPTLAIVAILRLAYLGTGLVLCLIGRSLIEQGIVTRFEGQGGAAGVRLRVVTASPGLVFALAGLFVIGLAIFRQVEIPVLAGPGTGTARFAQATALDEVAATLRARESDLAAAALVRAWRADGALVAPSLGDPRLAEAVAPAVRLLLAGNIAAGSADGTATLASVRARLRVLLVTNPRLVTRTADASDLLRRIEAARRARSARDVEAAMLDLLAQNPQALSALLDRTEPEDWSFHPGLFARLRDEMLRTAAEPPE